MLGELAGLLLFLLLMARRGRPIAKDMPKPKKALFIVIKTFSIVESSVKIKNKVVNVSFGLGKTKFP